MRRIRWFSKTRERRAASRLADAAVRAFYWGGTSSASKKVRDIGPGGAFIETTDRWRSGTLIHLVLADGLPDQALEQEHLDGASGLVGMWARVVRSAADGLAVEFLYLDGAERRHLKRFLAGLHAEKNAMGKNGSNGNSENGQSLVEFALVVPLLLLLIINIVNFGGLFYTWITVAHAARTGAQYMILGGASIGMPSPPSNAEIVQLVTEDVPLPDKATLLQVRVCTNNNSTVSCAGSGTAVDPPPDSPAEPYPEAGYFVLGTVDVTYQYQPFIPLWEFPGLAIHATLPPTTVQRRAAMRFIQ